MQPLEILRFTYGPFAENTYVVVGPSGRRAMVVDPGIGSEPVWDVVRDRGLAVELILNTHGHLDHVAGNAFFKRVSGAPIAIHAADRPMLSHVAKQGAMFGLSVEDSPPADLELVEGVGLDFDGATWDVLHTPGHTPGGVCLRLGGQMLDLLLACAQGDISQTRVNWADDHALSVVMAAAGYPGNHVKGEVITLPEITDPKLQIFHAGTAGNDGNLVSSGGRVLNITARGENLQEAHKRAYECIAKVNWPGGFYRKDIGWRAL